MIISKNRFYAITRCLFLAGACAIGLIAIIGSGGGGGGGSSVDTDLPPVDQLIYDFNFDDELKVKIDREGGEASLETETGIEITLSIPPNAVLGEQDFSLTPVNSIANTPVGFNPVVAVGIGSNDKSFALPLSITFNLPAGFRGRNIAVGFFSNSEGTEFYLTPLIGPDGKLAGSDIMEVSIFKDSFSAGGVTVYNDLYSNVQALENSDESSFSVGGVAVIDERHTDDQEYEISDRGNRAQHRLTKIRNDLIERQRSDDNATYTPTELHLINVIFSDWNADLRRRFGQLVLVFETGGVTEPTIKELLNIFAERTLMEALAQGFETNISDIEGFLSSEELVTELETVIDAVYKASYSDCLTNDLDKIDKSEDIRLTLVTLRQMFGVEALPSPDEIPCRFEVELSPEFTWLEDESKAAVVTALFKPYDPRTQNILPAIDNATFLLLGDFIEVEPSRERYSSCLQLQ